MNFLRIFVLKMGKTIHAIEKNKYLYRCDVRYVINELLPCYATVNYS